MVLDLHNIEDLQQQFKTSSFVVVRNTLSKDVLDYCYKVFVTYEKEKMFLDSDDQIKKGLIFTNTSLGNCLNLYFLDFMSSVVEKKLVITYDYSRCYLNGAVLEKHIDRGSCEYSITLCVKKGSCDYPIFFETKEGKTVEIELEEGDLIIYEGTKLNHWREKYEGDRHYQMFLHYIDKNGSFNLYKNDKFLENVSNYT